MRSILLYCIVFLIFLYYRIDRWNIVPYFLFSVPYSLRIYRDIACWVAEFNAALYPVTTYLVKFLMLVLSNTLFVIFFYSRWSCRIYIYILYWIYYLTDLISLNARCITHITEKPEEIDCQNTPFPMHHPILVARALSYHQSGEMNLIHWPNKNRTHNRRWRYASTC